MLTDTNGVIAEEWLPVHGMEGILDVSNLARVRTRDRLCKFFRNGKIGTQDRRGCIISSCLTKSGYCEVSVKIDGIRKKFLVHRLVARAFVPGYGDGLSVNHINGVKTDNRPENLEWVTLAENTRHQWETGLVDIRGDKSPNRKLSSQRVRAIRSLLSSGIAANKLAVVAGVNPSTIYLIRDGKRWSDLPPEP